LLSKVIGSALSPAQSQALSTIGIVPVIVGVALSKRLGSTGSRVRGSILAFAGGILGSIGNIAYYAVLNSGAKAATVVPFTAMYPLITVLLAVVFLKEKLNRIQLLGVGLSLVAIYLFNVQQEQGVASGWLLVALIPIGVWGVAGLLQKLSTNSISGELSTIWFLLAFVPVAVILLACGRFPVGIGARNWFLVILLGLTFALGNLAILLAFASQGKASIIVPLSALYPVVSIPIAIGALGEQIALREWIGIGAALASVAAITIETAPIPLKTPK
jgi:transporter family protein